MGIKDVRIVVNRNVSMSPGKMAAQAVHAALMAYGINHGSVVVLQGSRTKVESLPVVVQDAGLTEVDRGTITCGAELIDTELDPALWALGDDDGSAH